MTLDELPLRKEEPMLVHVYPHDDLRQLKALEDDEQRFALALYQGKRGNGDTYEIMPVNREAFKRLAMDHDCTVLLDSQVLFYM